MYETVIGAAESYQSIIDFITNGTMEQILSSIGDVETRAARDALGKINTSQDKRAPVLSAVTHLEAAHVAYQRLYLTQGIGRMISSQLAMYKDCAVMSLMAECYIYLKEGAQARNAAHLAYEARTRVELEVRRIVRPTLKERIRLAYDVPLTGYNPRSWMASGELRRASIPMEQVEEFQTAIGALAEKL